MLEKNSAFDKQINDYWQQYKISDIYLGFTDMYNEDELKTIFDNFMKGLLTLGGTNKKKWQVDNYEMAMELVFSDISDQFGDSDKKALTREFQDVLEPLEGVAIYAFDDAGNSKQGPDFDAMLVEVEDDFKIGAAYYPEYYTDPDADDKPPYKKPLDATQKRTLANIKSDLANWLADFKESDEWRMLNDAVSFDDADWYIHILVEQLYTQYHIAPKDWGVEMVRAVLTDYFVSNVGMTADKYKDVAPSLLTFVGFMKSHGLIDSDQANLILKGIQDINDTMIARAQEPQNYSESKKMILAMQEAKIDMKDQDAVNAFMARSNENTQAERASKGLTYDQTLVSQPKEDYLTMKHVAERDGHKFSKSVATKVHDDMARTAWYLWSQPAQQHLHDRLNEATFVNALVLFADEVYAQTVATPKRWNGENVQTILAGRKQEISRVSYQQLVTSLEVLVSYLVEQGKFTKGNAAAVQAVLDAEHEDLQYGKVVSMQQAKKLLGKKKKRNKRRK